MTYEDFFEDVKNRFLKTGELLPTLIVELESMDKEEKPSLVYILMADWPEAASQQMRMAFGLGMKLAEEHKDNRLASLYFASETWTSKQNQVAPVDDPNRGEAVVIMWLQCQPLGKIWGRSHPILRPSSDTVDLLAQVPKFEVHGGILPIVYAGFKAGNMSKEELATLMMRERQN